jgi:hypothetical protein
MRRVVASAAVAVAIAGGIYGMAELTQNRPDAVASDSETTVEFTVSTRGYRSGDEAAAAALWAVCGATVSSASQGPVRHGDAWHLTLRPAVGEHGQKRLVGCLEDVSLDRVKGNVVRVRSVVGE